MGPENYIEPGCAVNVDSLLTFTLMARALATAFLERVIVNTPCA